MDSLKKSILPRKRVITSAKALGRRKPGEMVTMAAVENEAAGSRLDVGCGH